MSATTAAAGLSSAVRLPGWLGLVRDRMVVELKVFARNPQAMFFMFSLPVLFLVLFSAVFAGDVDSLTPPGEEPVEFARYFLPGIIAAGVMSTTFATLAIGIAGEQHEGLLKRLAGTPLPRSVYFAGKLGMAVVVTVLQTAIMLAVGVVGYDVPLPEGAERWLAFGLTLTVGAGACALLGIAYTRLIPNARSAVAIVQPPFLILQFISGVFFQYNDIPGWLKAVAAVFPLRWLAQGLRYAFLPDWIGRDE